MTEPDTKRGHSRRIASMDRARAALELRRAGVPYAVIAGRLGFADGSGAHKAVHRSLAASVREVAVEYRNLELARLDRLQLAVWDKAIAGNCHAIDRVLSIMARRAKLLGLDAPRRRDVSGTVSLAGLAKIAAEGTDLDPRVIVAEAERLLREADCDGGDA